MCSVLSLSAWASGAYRIPGEPLVEEEGWSEADVPEGEGEEEF